MHQLKQLRHRIGFCDCEHLWLWAFEAAAWHAVSIARWTRDPMAPDCKRKNGGACQFNRTRHSRSKMVKAKAWIDALNLNFSCEGQLCWVGLATHLQSKKLAEVCSKNWPKLYQIDILYTRPARPLLRNLSAPKCKPLSLFASPPVPNPSQRCLQKIPSELPVGKWSTKQGTDGINCLVSKHPAKKIEGPAVPEEPVSNF